MSRQQEEKNKETSWRDNLSKEYKVVVLDEVTLNQKQSFSGSMMRLLILLGGFALLTSVLTVALLSFTPLKRLIPGYGDIEQNIEYRKLRNKLNTLEEEFDSQQVYINSLQKLLSGDKTDIETIATPPTSNVEQKKNKQIFTHEDKVNYKKARGLNSVYFTAPVNGTISSGFDPKINHLGVDILAPKGSAIKSAARGVVINSDWTMETGNTLSIQHANNTITVYKHNSALLKKVGDVVSAGEAVAIIGNSGTLSDGPHLHFELWYDGVPTNPEKYFTF